jgi:DNA-directed RNA polymerase specialized sigma24 family protein
VREIAELLGERTNTIEVALHRALERLRQDLATPTVSGEPRTQLL